MAADVPGSTPQTIDVAAQGCCCKQHFSDDFPSQLEGIMSPEAYRRVIAEQTKHQRAFWGPDTWILTPLTAGIYLGVKSCWHVKKMNKLLEQHPDIPHDKVKIRYANRSSGETSEDFLTITILACQND